jgi:hypothetical protein
MPGKELPEGIILVDRTHKQVQYNQNLGQVFEQVAQSNYVFFSIKQFTFQFMGESSNSLSALSRISLALFVT